MLIGGTAAGACVDDVANNQINHQFTSVIATHFMNSARVRWIIRTVFNVYIWSNKMHLGGNCQEFLK